MLGRPVATGSSLLRLPIYARRVVLRLAPFQSQSTNNGFSRAAILSSHRSYASTPGRPRSTVGEPSKTVKRAVKRAAKTTDGGEAKRQNAARKKTATKSKAKAKPKPKAPKVRTPEQQARRDARLAQEKIKNLKKAALSPPVDGVRLSAYSMYMKEKMTGATGIAGAGNQSRLGDKASSVAREWKSITPAEQEHYNHLAVQERERRVAEYKRWVESHTPEQIAAANRARTQLNRRDTGAKKTRYPRIKDERAPKRPVSAYVQFSITRQASGDFKNIAVPERSKLLSQEWRALTESEKKKYKDLSSEDLSRYNSEYTSTFGHEPPAQQAAATA